MVGNKVIIPLYHVDEEHNNQIFKNGKDIPESSTPINDNWAGDGLYFWNNIENAKYWLNQKQRQNSGRRYTIAHAQLEIDDSKILDLTTEEAANRFKSQLNVLSNRGFIEKKVLLNHIGAAINAYYKVFLRIGKPEFFVVKITGYYPNKKKKKLFYTNFSDPHVSFNEKTIYVVRKQKFLTKRSIIKG